MGKPLVEAEEVRSPRRWIWLVVAFALLFPMLTVLIHWLSGTRNGFTMPWLFQPFIGALVPAALRPRVRSGRVTVDEDGVRFGARVLLRRASIAGVEQARDAKGVLLLAVRGRGLAPNLQIAARDEAHAESLMRALGFGDQRAFTFAAGPSNSRRVLATLRLLR